jgi:hypothetical protein
MVAGRPLREEGGDEALMLSTSEPRWSPPTLLHGRRAVSRGGQPCRAGGLARQRETTPTASRAIDPAWRAAQSRAQGGRNSGHRCAPSGGFLSWLGPRAGTRIGRGGAAGGDSAQVIEHIAAGPAGPQPLVNRSPVRRQLARRPQTSGRAPGAQPRASRYCAGPCRHPQLETGPSARGPRRSAST